MDYVAYVICTSPRSGSTLLCHLLRETGVAGWPGSHFHEPSLDAWLDAYNLKRDAFDSHLDAVTAAVAAGVAHGKGQTDLFGLRLQRHSFDFFTEQMAILYPDQSTDMARIEPAFGKTLFVHLTRANKLDQAISYVKAQQTGLYHMAPDGTVIESLSEPKEPVYDHAAIADRHAACVRMDEEWQAWFAQEGIAPLTVTYDGLSADPHGTVARILGALGIAYRIPADAKVPVAKLADGVNAEWAARFRAETGISDG